MVSRFTHREKLLFAARMRYRPTPAEKVLRAAMRAARIPFMFSQVIVRGWILDFYHFPSGLAIEVDGLTHDKAEDARRDITLARDGIMTLRVTNDMVYQDAATVVRELKGYIRTMGNRGLSRGDDSVSLINNDILRDNKWMRKKGSAV